MKGAVTMLRLSGRTPTPERFCFHPHNGCHVGDRARTKHSSLSCCKEMSGAESAPCERRHHQSLADSVLIGDAAFGSIDIPAAWSVLDVTASIARSAETKL